MNRNTIEKKKANQFTVLSPFLWLFFFFSLYFSFIPFLLHALTNSFLFLFFVLPNFHYRGKQFLFSFFLSLSPFSFSLILFSFLSFSLSAFGRIIFQTLSPSFFLRHFWRLYNFNCQALGRKLPFLFSLSPIRHLLTNHFLVHLIFQHWGREFLISFSFSLSLSFSQQLWKNILLLHFRGALEK